MSEIAKCSEQACVVYLQWNEGWGTWQEVLPEYAGKEGVVAFRRDHPELDNTDFAHPAWWRGHEATVASMCQLIGRILDGTDDGSGIAGEPWDGVRQRLLELRKDRDALLAAAGFKAGPLGDDTRRKVILDDIAGMRPAMVQARREAQRVEGDALLWQAFSEDCQPLLLTVWKQRRAAERSARRLREAIEWMRERDDRNGSLPEAYRLKIDEALAPAP